MSIQTRQQLENTLAKFNVLEERLRERDYEPVANVRTRELTKQSLKKLANRLKEEIVRFESHRAPAST